MTKPRFFHLHQDNHEIVEQIVIPRENHYPFASKLTDFQTQES